MIKATGLHIIVKPIVAKDDTPGTSSTREYPWRGTVVSVGPGEFEEGEWITPRVKEGDDILYNEYGVDEMLIGGVLYAVIRWPNVLGVVTPDA